jgi:hypothetical protein
MSAPMTNNTKRNQVAKFILTKLTPGHHMVDVQVF